MVRILTIDNQISPYLLEVIKNDGSGRMVLAAQHSNGQPQRIVACSQRVFAPDIIDKAPVIDTETGAVAVCPTCGDIHEIAADTTSITCSTHGQFELFRGTTHSKRRPAKVAKAPAKVPVPEAAKPAKVARPSSKYAQLPLDLDALRAAGELWLKERIQFDHPGTAVRAYTLLFRHDDTWFKCCFNTYNGTLGRRSTPLDLASLHTQPGVYRVVNMETERRKLSANNYVPT